MAKSPAYQWYPKDILSSARVAELDLKEECAYRRALDYCWLNGSLPNDEKKLARVIGKGCSPKVAGAIIPLFTINPQDSSKLFHDRQEEERKKQAEFAERQSVNGKKGGRPKGADNHEEPKNDGKGLGFSGETQTITQTEAKKSSPSSSPSSIISSAKAEVPAGAEKDEGGEQTDPADTEAERKKSSAQKKKDATPHWQPLVDEWHRFYGALFKGGKPSFGATEGKALKELMAKLRRRTEDDPAFDGLEWTQPIALQALREFLTKAASIEWFRSNFLLPILNQKFDSIYDGQPSINGAAGAGGSGGGTKAGRPYGPAGTRGASVADLQSLKRGGTVSHPQRTDDAAFEVVG